MERITTKTSLFRAVMALVAVMLASFPACAQYMSFFGDSTWRYQVTYITQPPEEYQNYPPEEPNQLGIYCRTLSYSFRKDSFDGSTYISVPGHDSIWDWDLDGAAGLAEDTVFGRLYNKQYLICDMSLTEGDTFILKGMCDRFYDGSYYPNEYPVYRQWVQTDSIFFPMKVDSVRYVLDRKVIHLSLLDHLEDYFFGTGSGNLLSDYHFSIRFVEGIGPTYGLLSDCLYATPSNIPPPQGVQGPLYDWIINLHPWLGLMQCLYKDDSLVYMAHEGLECDQTCVGVHDYPQITINLYPNPATQYVVLDMSTGEEINGQVVITDMMGKPCHRQKVSASSVRIPVADLHAGMYFLTYTDGEKNVTRKFLKK